MMVLWIVVGLVIMAAVMLIVMAEEPEPIAEHPPGYTQDIDFSLWIKGYPVVNDVDLEYSEWLAANPEKVV